MPMTREEKREAARRDREKIRREAVRVSALDLAVRINTGHADALAIDEFCTRHGAAGEEAWRQAMHLVKWGRL